MLFRQAVSDGFLTRWLQSPEFDRPLPTKRKPRLSLNLFWTTIRRTLTNLIEGEKIEIDCAALIRWAALDVLDGVSIGEISAKFHNATANLILRLALLFRSRENLNKVALSGGCFQNVALLGASVRILREHDFEVFTHRQVPPNDGGLALGQAAIVGFRAAVD